MFYAQDYEKTIEQFKKELTGQENSHANKIIDLLEFVKFRSIVGDDKTFTPMSEFQASIAKATSKGRLTTFDWMIQFFKSTKVDTTPKNDQITGKTLKDIEDIISKDFKARTAYIE